MQALVDRNFVDGGSKMEDNIKSHEDFINPDESRKGVKWSAFIETEAINFFNKYEIEKLTLDDGNGNKAKLSRQKNEEIKVEYSSVTIL